MNLSFEENLRYIQESSLLRGIIDEYLSSPECNFCTKFEAQFYRIQTEILMVLGLYLIGYFLMYPSLLYLMLSGSPNGSTLSFLFLKNISLGSESFLYIISGITWYSVSFVCVLFMIGTPLVYVVQLGLTKIKMLLLIEFIDDFSKNQTHNDETFIYNTLMVIIEKHLEIKRFNTELTNVSSYRAFYFIGGMSLVTSFSIVLFTTDHKLCGVIGVGDFILISLVLCESSQTYADISYFIYHSIYNLKWYNWTKNCQKVYFMISQNASKGLHINVFRILPVGRYLLKKILKILYSIINLLR
ncbi:hypothetical protein ABEB36_009774 [Hypothenemus hampei]|uniref:Odorant receptor n=1 Tax=Hypothenemus hampei TaxID=57062 RepID=A0ABD1EKE4_HYPHA